jgi:hypothetical protein
MYACTTSVIAVCSASETAIAAPFDRGQSTLLRSPPQRQPNPRASGSISHGTAIRSFRPVASTPGDGTPSGWRSRAAAPRTPRSSRCPATSRRPSSRTPAAPAAWSDPRTSTARRDDQPAARATRLYATPPAQPFAAHTSSRCRRPYDRLDHLPQIHVLLIYRPAATTVGAMPTVLLLAGGPDAGARL